jgi:hypothetical protein
MTPYEEADAVFRRMVVSTEPDEDGVSSLVRLSCGHEMFVICFYPHTTSMPCAQCVNEYVRSQQKDHR